MALKTKKTLLSSLVSSIAGYGAECWTMKESEKKRLESFELWCYRRLLRISWTSRTTNVEVLQRIQPEACILDTVYRRKSSLVDHIIREGGELSRTLLLGTVYGPRGRGPPKTRVIDEITKACGGTHAMIQQAKDRRVCRRFVKEAMAIPNQVNRS